MKVMKFGGSPVADPQRVCTVTDVVLRAALHDRIIVVVSTFRGVTNQLLHSAHTAEKSGSEYETLYHQIAQRYGGAAITIPPY